MQSGKQLSGYSTLSYSVARFQKHLHMLLSPINIKKIQNHVWIERLHCCLNRGGLIPWPILCRTKDRYKESPIYPFFFLLQVETEADTSKDPFQQGIINHTVDIHKRQIIPEIMMPPLTCSSFKGGCSQMSWSQICWQLRAPAFTLILQKRTRLSFVDMHFI